jgi:PAS domain S-box-containing protein
MLATVHRQQRESDESRELLQSITDHLPVAVSYCDTDRRYRFVNKAAAAWLARSRDEIVGRTTTEILPADVAHESQRLFDPRLGKPLRLERTFTYPDGKTRSVDIAHIPRLDANGIPTGYYSVVIDVSERLATEHRLRQSQRMESIGQLTGGVAHDFNNLLTVVAGNLDLLRLMVEDNAEARACVDAALRAANRGASLTQSLLAFASKQPLAPSAVDLSALVRELVELIRRTLPKNIEINAQVPAGLWRCEADSGQLQNALLNLVTNGRDAMADGGVLTIEAANVDLSDSSVIAADLAPGAYVTVAVIDTGTGMPPEVAARIFEPFFTTKGAGKGTGLGLSMVYGFARQSGGTVQVISKPGSGTTMRLYLPRSTRADENVRSEPSRPGTMTSKTVLVVEDEPDVRLIAATMLRSMGHVVLEAGQSADALKILDADSSIDVLLTDMMLPGGMNGHALSEEARRRHPGLRILFMSGYSDEVTKAGSAWRPGPRLLHKPFTQNELAEKLRFVIESGPAA